MKSETRVTEWPGGGQPESLPDLLLDVAVVDLSDQDMRTNVKNNDQNLFRFFYLKPGHKPHKLIEGDATISILGNLF